MIHEGLATQTQRSRSFRLRNRAIDWLAIERDYLSGQLSLRALGKKHGCSHSTIANFASRHGWTRQPRKPWPETTSKSCTLGAVDLEAPRRLAR